MSDNYERQNINPNPDATMANLCTSQFDEHIVRSPAPLDEVDSAGYPDPEGFPFPPPTPALDIPRPSPTPYPFRARTRRQAGGKTSISDNESRVASRSGKATTEDYKVDSTDELELEATCQDIAKTLNNVPQRRGAIRRRGFTPPVHGGEHAPDIERWTDGPLGKARAPWAPDGAFISRKRPFRRAITGVARSPLMLTHPSIRRIQTEAVISKDSSNPAPRSNPASPQVGTGPEDIQRGNAQKGVLPSQRLCVNTLPMQTFEDLLKNVPHPKSAPIATSSFPHSPATSMAPSMMSLKSLTISTGRSLASIGKAVFEKTRPVLKKGQQIVAPKTTAIRRAVKLSTAASSFSNKNSRNHDAVITDLTNTDSTTLLLQIKQALERNRDKWTRDLPEPKITKGAEEFREAERILMAQPRSPDQSPSWALARHSWRSMDPRTQFEHRYAKPEDAIEKDEGGPARRSRWNRLEARRRVRLHSRVQQDFIESWEVWVSEQSADVQAEARHLDDDDDDEGEQAFSLVRDLAKFKLRDYFDYSLQLVDAAFDRQKDIAERLVLRNARRFPGMQ